MAAIATSALVKRMSQDPQVRAVARQLAGASVRALGQSRRRRANRGKYYVGKRVGIPPNRVRSQQMPAAVNVKSQGGAKNTYNVTKREKCHYDINCEGGSNGALYNNGIFPNAVDMFPLLHDIARSYTSYRFNRLRFSYQPRAPTDEKGMVYMGFDPQAHSSDSDWPNVSTVASLPRHAEGSIRGTVSLDIPCDKKVRYLTVPQDTAHDPLNYYLGHFVMMVQGDNITDVGDLFADYSITLENAKLDNETNLAIINPMAGSATGMLYNGHHLVSYVGADVGQLTVKLHSVRPLFIHGFIYGGASVDIDLTCDGVAVSSLQIHTLTATGHKRFTAYLGVPNASSEYEFTITDGNNSRVFISPLPEAFANQLAS